MTFRRKQKLPTGEALEQEAIQLGVSLNETGKGGAQGRTILDEPELQRRVLAARMERQNAFVNRVQTAGIIATLFLTVGLSLWNGFQQSRRESADLMIKFNQMLNSGGSRLIMKELDMHGDLNHIHVSGEDLDGAMDDFLNDYELLNAAYDYKLIGRDMAWDAFSYELETALHDPKIPQYIADSKRVEADMYDGVLDLARSFGIKFDPIVAAAPAAHALPSTVRRALH